MSFGILFIQDVNRHLKVCDVHVASKVPRNCCIGHMFNIKNITLKPIYDSLPHLTYIHNIAQIAFQAIKRLFL